MTAGTLVQELVEVPAYVFKVRRKVPAVLIKVPAKVPAVVGMIEVPAVVGEVPARPRP